MKTILKVIILFLIVFSFRIPYFYNTAVLSAVISIVYYFFSTKSIPFSQFKSWYVITLFVGTLLIIFADLLVFTLHEEYSFLLHQKRLFLVLFMLFALVLALPIMIEGKEDHAFEEAARVICYVFALQGAIHLTGFLYNPFGEYIISIQAMDRIDVDAAVHRNIARFRFYALSGSVFFELPSAYGVACIMFFRLQIIKGQKFISGYPAFIVLFLLIAGISLSGRTGFIGLFFGLFYFLIFAPNLTWTKNFQKWVVSVVVILIAFNLLTPKQRNAFYNDLFPFAFEAYYNLRDKGALSTGSTDVTMQVHYYPLKNETILWGHGTSSDELPFYEHTDAGYMMLLIYGGIFWLLAISIYQILYFIKPLSIANIRGTPEGKRDFWFFMLLLIYMFVLEYKGGALGLQYQTEVLFIFVGAAYLAKHYYRLDNEYSD